MHYRAWCANSCTQGQDGMALAITAQGEVNRLRTPSCFVYSTGCPPGGLHGVATHSLRSTDIVPRFFNKKLSQQPQAAWLLQLYTAALRLEW